MSETFTKSWRGWVKSSDGYAERMLGRTGVDYRDEHGHIRIDAEAMSSPWNEVVVYLRSLPDTPERPHAEVLDRLRRAFDFAGWQFALDCSE
ncbi:hypothetical protein BKA04_001291 [Cryobacterium mesophilum]|uniref:Uncharacterized protein n=1 Tax=Terrimesophilobacter mesophilus TaxID=433647 RepID=A0A4R8VAB0_9MICO|nr:hypothetical protein [Terrimesophilobacter mesophilus]MBB5633068.1 hypothetical protein [Terrimesophilobacter mesophilus]TFB79829.1 hypothetical protein E3N84_07095 [Terrimesophilobacter mesophilus]